MVEPGILHQELRGDRVGDVEREIADLFQVMAVLVMMQRGEVPEKQPVRCGLLDEFQITHLAGLEDARGGEVDLRFLISEF